MKHRPRLLVVITALLLCTLLFSACSRGPLLVATGNEIGIYYTYGTALTEVLTEVTGLTFDVRATAATQENLSLISAGKVDLAIVQNDVMDSAFNGIHSYSTTGRLTGYSAVCTLYAEVIQVIAAPEIGSIRELRGKRVSVGDLNSGGELNAVQVLEAHDLSLRDITVSYHNFADAAEKFAAGELDAFFITAGAPTANVESIVGTRDFHILSIGEEERRALTEQYDYYTSYTLPAGIYDGITEEVPTIAVMATLIASDSLSRKMVYAITKGIYDNTAVLSAAHEKGKELNVRSALRGISVPIHPGAEQYFTEIGLLVG